MAAHMTSTLEWQVLVFTIFATNRLEKSFTQRTASCTNFCRCNSDCSRHDYFKRGKEFRGRRKLITISLKWKDLPSYFKIAKSYCINYNWVVCQGYLIFYFSDTTINNIWKYLYRTSSKIFIWLYAILCTRIFLDELRR